MQIEPIDLLGPDVALHHVGLVVASIDEAHPGAGARKIHDPIQRVNVAFVDLHGAVVELIEPADERSPVSVSLKKGIKLAHFCFTVPDITAAMAAAEAHDCRMIAEPVPAVAFNGRKIAWLFHPVYGLIELLENA